MHDFVPVFKHFDEQSERLILYVHGFSQLYWAASKGQAIPFPEHSSLVYLYPKEEQSLVGMHPAWIFVFPRMVNIPTELNSNPFFIFLFPLVCRLFFTIKSGHSRGRTVTVFNSSSCIAAAGKKISTVRIVIDVTTKRVAGINIF